MMVTTKMSRDIGAQAFTHGNDIYFDKGKYNPNTREGKHLLTHELTHTIQQKGMIHKQENKKNTKQHTKPDTEKVNNAESCKSKRCNY